MTARVLVVGLDAGDGDLALRLVTDGRLPNLATLLASGAAATFDQPADATYIGAIWPTLMTGCRPEHHRYVSWAALDPASYAVVELGSEQIARAPLWMQLAEQSQRVAVIDVPRFSASRALGPDSLELYEWASHDRVEGLHSWPPHLVDELATTVPRPELGRPADGHPRGYAPCDWTHGGPTGPRTPEQRRALRDAILASVDAKTDLCEQLLDRGEWDLFLTVAAETHCAGHHLWAERTDSGDDDPVVAVYERLDASLGRLVEGAGPDATTVVVFSHAMSANPARAAALEVVLDRIARTSDPRATPTVGVAKWSWARLPRSLRRRLHPAVAGLARRAARGRTIHPDPPIADRASRPYAGAPGAAAVAGVRLNQVGREARGIVRAEDRAATLRLLTDQLLDLVDLDTGRSAVRRVVAADDAPGSFPDDGQPDLLVEWDDRAVGGVLYSPAVGIVTAVTTTARTGDHREGGGLLVAHGPGITPSAKRPNVGPEDVAPTIAALCGVTLRDVDGRPVRALLSADARASSSAPH